MQKVLKATLVGLIACALPLSVMVSADTAQVPAGLEKVKVKRLDHVYARPGIDWSQYSKVIVDPLDMSQTVIKAPSHTLKKDIPTLNDKNSAPFKASFMKAFTREFTEDDLLVEVKDAKPGTLRISAKLLEIAPTYFPNSRTEFSSRNKVYSETAGKLEMQFEIRDAATGELLTQATDKREANRMWRENNPIENRAQINQIMGTWARIFRTHLEDVAGQ